MKKKRQAAILELVEKFDIDTQEAMLARLKEEGFTVSGDVLMNAGAALKQAFSGTGFNDNVRMFGDFASRMYFLEAVEE